MIFYVISLLFLIPYACAMENSEEENQNDSKLQKTQILTRSFMEGLEGFCANLLHSASHAGNLFEALDSSDFAAIERFATPQTVNTIDAHGCTPLLKATARYEHNKTETLNILQILLRKSANLNQTGFLNNLKLLPLDVATGYALTHNDFTVVRLFLGAGANPKLITDPDEPEEELRCAYDMAKDLVRLPNLCPCSRGSCPGNTQSTATRLLEIFDAHLANKTNE